MTPPPVRFSLAILMAFIAVIAVGLVAMKFASPTFARIGFALDLIALLVGTLGLMVGRRRASWIGFCLLGWSAALTALAPPIRVAIVPYLPIHKPLDRVIGWIGPVAPTKARTPFDINLVVVMAGAEIESPPIRIGHEVLALGFALCGAMAGNLLSDRASRDITTT